MAGQTCWTSGASPSCSLLALVLAPARRSASPRGSSASAVCWPVATASSCSSWRYSSTAGQSAPLRTSFHTPVPYVRSPRRRRSRRGTPPRGCSATSRGRRRAPRWSRRNAPDAAAGHVRVQHHADERAVVGRPLGAGLERLGERVVDEPHVAAVRRDRRRRVVAAVAGRSTRRGVVQVAPLLVDVVNMHVLVVEPVAAVDPAS